MEIVTLGELPVGALFVRRDEWGDGKTLYVKLDSSSFGPQQDYSACHCGTPSGGRTGPINAEISVQQISAGPHVETIVFCLASSLQEQQAATKTKDQ